MDAAEDQHRHTSGRKDVLEKSPKRASKTIVLEDNYATPSTSMGADPPRIVTPDPSTTSNAEGFEYRHKPTVTSRGLNYVSPLKPKEPNMKFKLGSGKVEQNTVAGLEKENFSTSDNKILNFGKMTARKTSDGSSFASNYRKTTSNVVGNSKTKTLSGSRRKQDSNSYKIFLLLLQPKLKTFELIQLIYSPTDTTIGDIISMIPDNATEAALGSQTYTGLCRPKTEEEIVDHELLASEPRANTSVDSAKITLGEILVAIPYGYNGADVAVLAKQILSNPKIVKLLKRSDPLAPKKSRRSNRRGLRKSSRRSRSKEHVEVMEKFDEEDEIKQEEEKKEQEQRMKEAMEHAAQEAAASNAQIPGGRNSNLLGTVDRNVSRHSSIVSFDGSHGEEKSTESSLQESIDESYSSWSKSFDASFTSSVCSGVSKRSARRRDRQSRRMKIIQRSVVFGFVIMLAMYFIDPHGYRRTDAEKQVSQAATTENPMGLTGIFQCLFLLLSLYQVELFMRTTSATSDNNQDQSSFLEFIQSTRAMKKLKSRFYKKLKKPSTRIRRGAVGAYDYDENTSTQKLRSFSLKGNNGIRSNSIDESDTGSL
mmetsp:Transcript_6339/g.15704  ORF Transcript_6339/g.15704 Transcript_6339/m.15704 type:complete len:594 (+) Transcript_6339:189-1970(+)|eukprot:CAMPEP_0197192546 /NCGR_PEP_ID=MMETSP1423-20130617/25211_1 /TAXON_ID=476441 /ORGANISM="Pseudo-nitzschia heimii, Strain UNC1101" /LENGTH=593 /DNA_ID=CAMNT_0042645447 /DNA_START=106 /DNA_END=1887 /DNA_ORIENTATION=+